MMGTHRQDETRLCDFCSQATALLYCRADSAKLCLSCDREVHSTNQLFTNHSRCLLCDRCDSSPASIFCRTDNNVLCQNCDWEAHKTTPTSSSLGLHDRRPLDGFTGQPSVSELLGILGFDDLGEKSLLFGNDDDHDAKSFSEKCSQINNLDNSNGADGEYGLLDMLAWDSPAIVIVDELIASNHSISPHNFQAMGVPPLPKNRNAVCGKHKTDIVHQLQEMSKSEHDFSDYDGFLESFIDFQTVVPGQDCPSEGKETDLENNVEPKLAHSHEIIAFQWYGNGDEVSDELFPSTLLSGHTETNYLVPEKDSDFGGSSINVCSGQEGQSNNLVTGENIQPLLKVGREINTQERDSAISRYKEKKKTRRYEKHIRYESRKVRAESRTRIKGRFAKMGRRDTAAQ